MKHLQLDDHDKNKAGGTKRIYIHRNNSETTEACSLVVADGMTMKKLALSIEAKLAVKPKRYFLSNGSEIFSVEEMYDNDQIFISNGEGFYKSQGPEILQLAILGAENVGKSALSMRFIKNQFVEVWDPTIEDLYRKHLDIKSKRYIIDLLDTAGQADFESLRPQWINGKDGIIFVHSLLPKQLHESIKELDALYEVFNQIHLEDTEGTTSLPKVKVPLIVIGNKKDLVKPVSPARTGPSVGQQAATRFHADHYFEASAKTGENVDNIFETMINCVIEAREDLKRKQTTGSVTDNVPKCNFCVLL